MRALGTIAGLCGAFALLLSGCGGSDEPPVVPAETTAPAPTTSTVIVPEATVPATSGTTAPRLPPRRPKKGSRAGYLQRLDVLAGRAQAALGAASRTQDSGALTAIDEDVRQATTAWRTRGGEASPAAAALAAAMATAISNLESTLLTDESRRQLDRARRAVQAERAAAG